MECEVLPAADFFFIGNTVIHSCVKVELSYEIKTLREDAQLAVRKISLCETRARGESRKRDSFYVDAKIRLTNTSSMLK